MEPLFPSVATPKMEFAGPTEFRRGFSTLESWARFWTESPWIDDAEYMKSIVEHASVSGVTSEFLGSISAREVSCAGSNYRETFVAREFNARQRALLDLAQEALSDIPRHLATIYAHEALTNLALILRGRYVRFVGSEYASTVDQRNSLFPILTVDIEHSPFPDSAFDLVLSGDVFEHVPDMREALADSARILKPGGKLLATFPFASGSFESVVRAKMVSGQIVHLMEPEYHGNPTSPTDRSLVFQVPGWSIVDLCLSAGFTSAEMIFWASRSRGIMGDDIAGIFVLSAVR